MKNRYILALLATLLLSPPLLAHTDAVLVTKARHGGQVRDAGSLHLELVVKTGELMVHVSDANDKPVDTQGGSGTAMLLSSKGKATVKLVPAGGSALKGVGQFDPAPGMKAAISLSLPGKPAIQARFTPMEK